VREPGWASGGQFRDSGLHINRSFYAESIGVVEIRMKKVKIRKSPALEKMKKFQAEKVWRKDAMKIAIRILHILEEKGMTQRDLADHLGKSPQWVNKICKGQQNLTIGTINELQEALGVTLVEVSKRERGTIPVEIN